MSNAEKILNEISDLHYDDWQKEDILKAMQAHTNKALSELEKEVISELNELGIPNPVSKKELYDVMYASTPQEIGEIKARLSFLDIITKAKDNE